MEQLSDAVGTVQVATALQDAFAETVMLDGHPVMTGFMLSVTITLNVQVEVLPAPSVAVYVTGVVPSEKRNPEVCVLVKLAIEQLSEAVGAVQVAIALQDALAETIMLDGHPVITGLVLSLTITLKVQVAVLPEPSVAVYVTGVVPSEKRNPEVCVLVKLAIEQLSEAVGAVQVAMALQDAFAETIMLDGHPVITGFVLSVTITSKLHVDVFPDASVAV